MATILSRPQCVKTWMINLSNPLITGDPLHSRAACTQPCNVNTHSRAHCSPGARLCEQWEHGCVNNGARLCASARLCRGSPVLMLMWLSVPDFNCKRNLVIDMLNISSTRNCPQVNDLANDLQKIVQVMAWCHQTIKYYLSQCLPKRLSPYGVNRP